MFSSNKILYGSPKCKGEISDIIMAVIIMEDRDLLAQLIPGHSGQPLLMRFSKVNLYSLTPIMPFRLQVKR